MFKLQHKHPVALPGCRRHQVVGRYRDRPVQYSQSVSRLDPEGKPIVELLLACPCPCGTARIPPRSTTAHSVGDCSPYTVSATMLLLPADRPLNSTPIPSDHQIRVDPSRSSLRDPVRLFGTRSATADAIGQKRGCTRRGGVRPKQCKFIKEEGKKDDTGK